jgi:hypothetical protein
MKEIERKSETNFKGLKMKYDQINNELVNTIE